MSRVLPLPSPRRAAAAFAAAALTLQSHPAAEPDAEEQAEHIRYTPITNNKTAPQHFTRRFFLSSSPPLRVYFAPGWLRWRGWKCGRAERGGRVPPAPSTAPAEGAWRKQPFRRREFLDVDARRLSALWRDQLDGVDAGSCWAGGVRRCSEYHGYPRRDKHHSRAQGKHSGKQKGAFIDFSTPIFAIVHAVYNALTSIIKMEHKFQLFGELLDLQVVSAVLFSYISAQSIIPSQQCRNPEQFIFSQLHQ